MTDELGAPAPGAIVYIVELDGFPKLALAADAKGCYKQTDVPDGFYEVRAEWNGIVIDRRNVTLEKVGVVTVDLRYKPKPPQDGPPLPPMINLKMLAEAAKEAPRDALSTMLKSLTFTLKVIDAGDPTMATIELARPAPPEGMAVRLSVNQPLLAVIPDEVTVPEGATKISFPITTHLVRGPSDVVLRLRAMDGEGAITSLLTIRSHTRLTVRIQGTGKWRVTSMPPGLSCKSDVCTSAFAEGAKVQLWAEVQPDTEFMGWSGDCSADGEVVVSGPMKCGARFSGK